MPSEMRIAVRSEDVSEDVSTRAADDPFARLSMRVGFLSAAPDLLKQFKQEPSSVLREAGLSSDALAHADNRIKYLQAGRLLEVCVARTGCEHFGFLLGKSASLNSMGVLGEIARHSPTVGSALRSLVALYPMSSEGGLWYLLEHDGVADFGYGIFPRGMRAEAQMFDLMAAASQSILRELCQSSEILSEIFLPYAERKNVAILRPYFRTPIQYNAEACVLRFSSKVLALRLADADNEQLLDARQRAATLLQRPSLIPSVYRAIRLLLLHGKACGDDVAASFAMHRRTFNRRLQDEGTTFRRVLSDARFDLACQLLSSTSLPIDDIAGALAYQSVTSFIRSFKRWANTTPGLYRTHGISAADAVRVYRGR